MRVFVYRVMKLCSSFVSIGIKLTLDQSNQIHVSENSFIKFQFNVSSFNSQSPHLMQVSESVIKKVFKRETHSV